MTTDLIHFHPIIREWFADRFSQPTDVQLKAWPGIAEGRHLLITAPTGSGKTLTAFLWAINRFATGDLKPGATRVLYVSPLKALNNDIRQNLMEPVGRIRNLFREKGQSFPDVRVMTRSGDTSQEDRRKMFRHPPEILITTPESLNLLLSSKSGRSVLCHLSTVILDEIHAVAGTKRGVHLITAVDRLVRLSGEFQRICLSATVRNPETVSQMAAGSVMTGSVHDPQYRPRTVDLIRSTAEKRYQIEVKYPGKEAANAGDTAWDLLARECRDIVEKNRSTLLFTNSRRLCEKMTFKLNRLCRQPMVYSHHGSLSRSLRQNVEQSLKQGDLKAIVATSSLELGIDIGSLDEVVLIQSTPSISSAVQRIGRAGHQVGELSCGTFFCAHPQDLIASAVLARAVNERDIEPIEPVECPLDVLSQVIISETCMETWDVDELYAFIRTSRPYRNLTREQYDLVLNMLAGRYADTRIRELSPRVSIDRLDNTVAGRKGALLALYTSGGTIPDRGYYRLRHHETAARIGELDEEYVWEAKIGQIVTMGTQNWKITKITHNDVFARPAGSSGMDAPFWIAEGINRDAHFSNRILHFLEQAQEKISRKAFAADLERQFFLDAPAAEGVIQLLKRQEEATGSKLPHRHHILLEYVKSGPDGGSEGTMLVLHTLWGGRLNRPLALAMEAAWIKKFKTVPEIFPGNDAIVIQLPHKISPEEILSLVPSAQMEALLKQQLEKSGFFAARFRECAGRALLVVKNRMNQRMPLWMTRLKSKKLLENILRYEDFPILLETWRTCLNDEFDLDRLQAMLQEIESGRISWSHCITSRPSPFAAGMAWNQINQYMYKEDEGASQSSALGNDLVRDLVFSPQLRPAIPATVVTAFEQKCQRLLPGYAPSSARDLIDWVKERVAIPWDEWEALLRQVNAVSPDTEQLNAAVDEKLLVFHLRHTRGRLVVSREFAARVKQAWYPDHPGVSIRDTQDKIADIQNSPETDAGTELLAQWLQFYGPRSLKFIQKTLGLAADTVSELLDDLSESRQVISGLLVKDGPEDDVCDSENFEILLRMSRARAVPQFEALDIDNLPLFLARHQGIVKQGSSVEHLFERLEQLVCLPLPARSWESEIFPARILPYHPSFLDSLLLEGELVWLGFEKQKTAFSFLSDLDFIKDEKTTQEPSDELDALFKTAGTRYDFAQLMELTGLNSGPLAEQIWEKVWQTKLCNEAFSALRKGIETQFKAPEEPAEKPRPRFGRRGRASRMTPVKSFARWKGGLPFGGRWYKPDIPPGPQDEMEALELNKDRVRLLLDRYGILFRELLIKEAPGFRWPDIFRSLRLMELSGEIVTGHFFKGIPGLQFISHAAFRTLLSLQPEESIFFMNAADPASVCGLPLPEIKNRFPSRRPTTHLVFQGKEIRMISRKNGRELEFFCKPDDDHMVEFLAPLTHLLTRPGSPLKKITIDSINGEKASASPYIDAFETVFNLLREYKSVTLYRKADSFF